MKDVAAMAGLSIATVSKYLNGEKLRDENRKKIKKAITVLGYRRNEIARGLKTKKSMTIGMLVPDIRSSFFTKLISGIENILSKNFYSTLVCDFQNDEEMEKKKMDFLYNKMVDGMIIVPQNGDEDLISEISANIPVVILDRSLKNLETDFILTDNREVSIKAIEYLIDSGHKKIGIITGPHGLFTSEERLKGYKEAHQIHDIPINENFIQSGGFDMQQGYHAAKKILLGDDRPTALYVINYDMTLGSLMAINELGLSIPRDISIIGFDSLEMSNIIQPQLTLVLQPYEQIIEVTANLLLKRLTSKEPKGGPETIILKNRLLIGESVLDLKEKSL